MTLKLIAPAMVVLVGCTHASISSIPLQIEGIGTVYRYQGRANFAHQIAEADRMITEDCKTRNGGRPVIVDLQRQDLGTVVIGSGQATTQFNATTNGSLTRGSATTNAFGSRSALRNFNQEILYKCVAD